MNKFTINSLFYLGKQRRIKQARDEAASEAEQYKVERDRQFREYEAKYMGSREDILAKIENDTEKQMVEMEKNVEKFKEPVREKELAGPREYSRLNQGDFFRIHPFFFLVERR